MDKVDSLRTNGGVFISFLLTPNQRNVKHSN